MGIIKFGGITFICSGILFFIQYLLVLPMPAPPTVNAELMAWLQIWNFNLAMADEILLFAPLCLIPSIAALYKTELFPDIYKLVLSMYYGGCTWQQSSGA